MRVNVRIEDVLIHVPVGTGGNSVKWLSLVAATRFRDISYPHRLRIPLSVQMSDGTFLKPRQRLCECLKDDSEVRVVLTEDITDSSLGFDSVFPAHKTNWYTDAFGPNGHLCETSVHWITDKAVSSIPRSVSGYVLVDPQSGPFYRCGELRIAVEAPLEPVNKPEGGYDWIAKIYSPPGIIRYRYSLSDLEPTILSTALPIISDETGNGYHEVLVDVNIPYMSKDLVIPARKTYSVDFLLDWSRIKLPESLLEFESVIAELIATNHQQLATLYTILLLFDTSSESRIRLEDVAYLLSIQNEEDYAYLQSVSSEQLLDRAGMIELLLLWLHRGNQGDLDRISSEMSKLEYQRYGLLAQKALLENRSLRKICLKFHIVYSKKLFIGKEYFKGIPFNTFLGLLEILTDTVGLDGLEKEIDTMLSNS
jgi:hypothetical protein